MAGVVASLTRMSLSADPSHMRRPQSGASPCSCSFSSSSSLRGSPLLTGACQHACPYCWSLRSSYASNIDSHASTARSLSAAGAGPSDRVPGGGQAEFAAAREDFREGTAVQQVAQVGRRHAREEGTAPLLRSAVPRRRDALAVMAGNDERLHGFRTASHHFIRANRFA